MGYKDLSELQTSWIKWVGDGSDEIALKTAGNRYLKMVSEQGSESTFAINPKPSEKVAALNMGGAKSIGTVAHEFFHSWNVERIRPDALEPFSFDEANMTGALWFAEGFTSYYTSLILCRSGLINREEYIDGLTRSFNYVLEFSGASIF